MKSFITNEYFNTRFIALWIGEKIVFYVEWSVSNWFFIKMNHQKLVIYLGVQPVVNIVEKNCIENRDLVLNYQKKILWLKSRAIKRTLFQNSW